MKSMRHIRLALFGTAILAFAGAANAQSYVNTYIHGNSCTGGGVTPSQYGVYNPSTTSSADVTCSIPNAWPMNPGAQQRWIQVSYYNRSSTAGAFTCKLYGIGDGGTIVWNPATVVFPTGAVGSSVAQLNVGQPPTTAEYFTMSCTIPKGNGAGNGYSYITAIGVKIGS